MNEERHEEIMTAISNLSAQFSEMLREFKKRGELLHEADDASDTSRPIKWFILTEILSEKS